MKERERNACKAFIEILKEIKGITYEKVDCPDERNRKTQDVDAILAPKYEDTQSLKIAAEHTIVEAHEKQFKYVNQLFGIEKEIEQRCQGKMPVGYGFNLIAPPSLIAGMNKKNRVQFVRDISSWIPGAAKSLIRDQESSRLYNGHEVSLCCVSTCSGISETISIMPSRPGDAEKERQERLHRAIEEKLPKLIKYKERGFATALLLEDVSAVYTDLQKNLNYLMSSQYLSEFKSKIDYVVIFVSQKDKMFLGLVWKDESHLYSDISENRIFSFQQ